MLERLQWNASFLALLAERVQAVIPPSASFAGVRCIKDVVLEVNRKSMSIYIYTKKFSLKKVFNIVKYSFFNKNVFCVLYFCILHIYILKGFTVLFMCI